MLRSLIPFIWLSLSIPSSPDPCAWAFRELPGPAPHWPSGLKCLGLIVLSPLRGQAGGEEGAFHPL